MQKMTLSLVRRVTIILVKGVSLFRRISIAGFYSVSLVVLFICCIGLFFSCVQREIITPPKHTNDGWDIAHLEESGLNRSKLEELIRSIRKGKYKNIHSILIVKNQHIVLEEYFSGYIFKSWGNQNRGKFTTFTMEMIHNLASVTKSITSALIGIAMDQGLIKGVDEKVFSFFPGYMDVSTEKKETITLHHLLTMTSGLQWNEQDISYNDTSNDIVQLFIVPDPVEYILSKTAIFNPGERWYYNGGGTNLLGEIIHRTSGVPVDRFAEKYLFSPLGITDYEWININPDIVYISGDLKLKPRDMAKFGYLFLNKGIWKGRRILSEEWIVTSTKLHVFLNRNHSYGYQWWLRTYRVNSKLYHTFYANGWGGQKILVFPDSDMVIVTTGGNYTEYDPTDEILVPLILKALLPTE